MSNLIETVPAKCIIFDGHRIYWHGTQHKRCRAYTDVGQEDSRRVAAKGLLRRIASIRSIKYPKQATTDQLAALVFDETREPGWDAKAISETIKRVWGDYTTAFKAHGWPERGAKMMGASQSHVVERYGSVEKFVSVYAVKG